MGKSPHIMYLDHSSTRGQLRFFHRRAFLKSWLLKMRCGSAHGDEDGSWLLVSQADLLARILVPWPNGRLMQEHLTRRPLPPAKHLFRLFDKWVNSTHN